VNPLKPGFPTGFSHSGARSTEKNTVFPHLSKQVFNKLSKTCVDISLSHSLLKSYVDNPAVNPHFSTVFLRISTEFFVFACLFSGFLQSFPPQACSEPFQNHFRLRGFPKADFR